MKLNSEEWVVLQGLLQKNKKLSAARAAYLKLDCKDAVIEYLEGKV